MSHGLATSLHNFTSLSLQNITTKNLFHANETFPTISGDKGEVQTRKGLRWIPRYPETRKSVVSDEMLQRVENKCRFEDFRIGNLSSCYLIHGPKISFVYDIDKNYVVDELQYIVCIRVFREGYTLGLRWSHDHLAFRKYTCEVFFVDSLNILY